MDWKKIVTELTDAGHTQIELAEACGCSQPTISALKDGTTADPKASIGLVLADLHRRLQKPRRRMSA